MGRSRSPLVLLVAALLALSVCQGFGRRMLMETADYEGSSVQFEESEGGSRMMIDTTDYKDPEPNTNPRTGAMLSPPDPPVPLPPLPPPPSQG